MRRPRPRSPNPIVAAVDDARVALDPPLSRELVSRQAGLSRDFLRKLEERGPQATTRVDNLAKLARVLGVPVEQLYEAKAPAGEPPPPGPRLAGEVRPAPVRLPRREEMPRDVPVLGTASGSVAGNKDGSFSLTAEVIDFVRRPPALAGVRDAYAFYVENESMVPEHKPGELRFVHPHRMPQIGDSVVIQTKRHEEAPVECFIKRLVRRTDEKIVAEQLNPAARIDYQRRFIIAVHKVLTLNDLFGV
jgi:phage repressor protein C with HTH and peptisase S24 domain